MLGYDAGASGSLVGEYDGSGNLIQETVWLGDIPVATIRPSGSSVTIYYVEADHLDTPREIISPSGVLIWARFSGPFGLTDRNITGYDLRFPGQIAGSWGGTYQNNRRDYDPVVGRYVESDPIGLAGRSYSTYAYVNDDPTSKVDPRGLYACTYSISAHSMSCAPTLPGDPNFSSNQYVSGNNGGGGSSVALYYVETDQLDTPRQVIRPSDNAQMWTWFSGPFGSETPNTNPQGAGTFTYDLRFPGQIAGTWGATYQNGYRDYDPAVGSFSQSDPLGLAGSSYSTYSYAGGSPISYADPSGPLQSSPRIFPRSVKGLSHFRVHL